MRRRACSGLRSAGRTGAQRRVASVRELRSPRSPERTGPTGPPACGNPVCRVLGMRASAREHDRSPHRAGTRGRNRQVREPLGASASLGPCRAGGPQPARAGEAQSSLRRRVRAARTLFTLGPSRLLEVQARDALASVRALGPDPDVARSVAGVSPWSSGCQQPRGPRFIGVCPSQGGGSALGCSLVPGGCLRSRRGRPLCPLRSCWSRRRPSLLFCGSFPGPWRGAATRSCCFPGCSRCGLDSRRRPGPQIL